MLAIVKKMTLCCMILLMLVCGAAWADQNHYTNMLIGDRATGLGGAYTAVSDDTSGLYYNPAGVVYSSGRNLSASVNAFYNLTKEYDNVIGGYGWKRKSSALLPNFFGIIQPVDKYKIGLSYAVPDSVQEDQDQVFTNFPSATAGVTVTRYIINFNNDDSTYNFGPSFAVELVKDLSIGATLYIHHRRNQMITNQIISLDTGETQWESSYYQIIERGYRPVLGFMWAPIEKLSVGLSIAKTILYGTSVQSQATAMTLGGITPGTTFNALGVTENKKYPLQVRGGIAFFPSGSTLITLDGIYSSKLADPVFGNKVSVLNGALGAEYYFSKNWAVRGGIYTDMANTPEVKTGYQDQQENADLYGITASVSNFTRNTSVTLGMNIVSGSGKAQLVPSTDSIQNLNVDGWMIFLSSMYSY